MEEAKAVRDEAIAMANSLKSKQEGSVQVAKKKIEEKIARAVFKLDEAMKALEEERVDQRVREMMIREKVKQEAIGDIFKFRMTFKHSAYL